jgi:hypothetical protein
MVELGGLRQLLLAEIRLHAHTANTFSTSGRCDLYKSLATLMILEDVVANIHSPSIMHCARSH